MRMTRGPLWAISRYEFLMQIRRKALWIAIAVISVWFFVTVHLSFANDSAQSRRENGMTFIFAMILVMPIIVGFFLADRLARDRQLGTGELLATSPASHRAYVWGKFIGATAATTLVAFAGFLFFTLALWQIDGVGEIGRVLLAYLLVVLPGLLFVSAYSIACPTVLPVRLYQVLFAGYWLWNHQQIVPSPQGTPFDPRLPFVASLLEPHGSERFFGPFGWVFHATLGMAALNLALILGLAIVGLVALERHLIWQEARR